MKDAMKNRIGVVLLVVACLGLLVGLLTVNKQATDRARKDADKILTFSNEVVNADVQINDLKKVNLTFESDLAQERKNAGELTNQVQQVSAKLTATSSNLAKTEASLKQVQADLAEREAKINSLETQNQQLDKQAIDLSTQLTNLTTQIADTQKKLSASEGDKAFLEKELKRLMAEKAELERQFNDLAVLRAQVAKLKEELNIARRIEWIRQGLFANTDMKGAQKLMQGVSAPVSSTKTAKPAYDLNVEISADGSVKVMAPKTNAPVANPAPGK
jgi:chromosome segregation ATPase